MTKQQNTINQRVKVLVSLPGDVKVNESGYMLLMGEKVAAFYLDVWSNRAYPSSSCSSVWVDGQSMDLPSITLEDGNETSERTAIFFPDFPGWEVHSVSGGKTLSICLTRWDE